MRDFHLPGRSPVHALNGMAATSHPLASVTAIDMLKAGGNAVDAALAAAFVLGLAEPPMCGIGGDCFVLLKPAGSDTVIGLNGSGRAPAGLSAETLRASGHARMPLHGIHPVTLPGAIDAFCRLHEDHGCLPLDRILAPAIRHAEDGVPVAARVAFDWADDLPVLQGHAREVYSFQGRAPHMGEVFRNPGQAEVLRRIAREGRKGFYEGEVAEDIVASLRALGGTHTLDDLAATACDYTQPIAGAYGDLELLEHPPNGQGATAILMLNILRHFDLKALPPFGPQRAHLEAEAAKLAYDARDRFIADPAPRLDHMLSRATADRLAALIDLDRAMPDPAPVTERIHGGTNGAIHRDTVYLTVVDRDRMAISLIYSLFWGFGSGLASDRFGINFQNRGAGFSLVAGHPNEAAGGKRPMHTIIPGMIRRAGRVIMPFGVMGGGYQPCGHVRFLTNIADYGLDVQAAMDAPRSFAGPEAMEVERGYSDTTRAALAQMGHAVSIPATPLGGSQAILIGGDGVLTGGSDPRKDGCALGY